MNTHQAQYESAIERLRADMAGWHADAANRETEWKTDSANRELNWKTDAAKRENRMLLSIFGAVGLATAILGLLIAFN